MTPEEVPAGPLLVDTDVLSLLAFHEERSDEFEELVRGHELFVAFVTRAEVESLLRLNALDSDHTDALRVALYRYSRLELNMDKVVDRWAAIRAATRTTTSRNDRERRQNDTWLAACATSLNNPPPIVTADLRDLRSIAQAAGLTLVHPDL